jgi:hypothetical protein
MKQERWAATIEMVDFYVAHVFRTRGELRGVESTELAFLFPS